MPKKTTTYTKRIQWKCVKWKEFWKQIHNRLDCFFPSLSFGIILLCFLLFVFVFSWAYFFRSFGLYIEIQAYIIRIKEKLTAERYSFVCANGTYYSWFFIRFFFLFCSVPSIALEHMACACKDSSTRRTRTTPTNTNLTYNTHSFNAYDEIAE